MVVYAAFGTRALGFALLSTLAFGCNRSKSEAPPAADTAVASAASAASMPQKYEMKERAKAGFPVCLVGKWKSTKATLQVDQVRGEGGENVKLEIEGTGRSTIDFAEMADIHANTPAFKFEQRRRLVRSARHGDRQHSRHRQDAARSGHARESARRARQRGRRLARGGLR
jgi:hypothetical protein